jgi:glycine cleavage system aminomethyltransferase T
MAMALLDSGCSQSGLEVDVRGKMIEAEPCAMPFYKRSQP